MSDYRIIEDGQQKILSAGSIADLEARIALLESFHGVTSTVFDTNVLNAASVLSQDGLSLTGNNFGSVSTVGKTEGVLQIEYIVTDGIPGGSTTAEAETIVGLIQQSSKATLATIDQNAVLFRNTVDPDAIVYESSGAVWIGAALQTTGAVPAYGTYVSLVLDFNAGLMNVFFDGVYQKTVATLPAGILYFYATSNVDTITANYGDTTFNRGLIPGVTSFDGKQVPLSAASFSGAYDATIAPANISTKFSDHVLLNEGAGARVGTASTVGHDSGKHQVEFDISNTITGAFGIVDTTQKLSAIGSLNLSLSKQWVMFEQGNVHNNNVELHNGASVTGGDTIGLLLDLVADTIEFKVNGVTYGGALAIPADTYFFTTLISNNQSCHVNVGDQPYKYPEIGYESWNGRLSF